MNEIFDIVKKFPKELIKCLILELMVEERISFHEIAEAHVEYLQKLKRGETEKLINLRSDVIDLWVSKKKDLPKKLTQIVRRGMEEGWINITEEQINNSKWNKNGSNTNN